MTAATIDELIVSLSRVNAASKVALRAVEADREGLPVGRHRAPAVAVVGVPCEVHTFSFPLADLAVVQRDGVVGGLLADRPGGVPPTPVRGTPPHPEGAAMSAKRWIDPKSDAVAEVIAGESWRRNRLELWNDGSPEIRENYLASARRLLDKAAKASPQPNP